MRKKFRLLAIAVTILCSIALSVFQITFPVSLQESLLVVIVGFIVSVLLGVEELRQMTEEKQREIKEITREVKETVKQARRFNSLIERKSLYSKLVPLCETLTKIYSEEESVYTELIENRITDLLEYTSEVAAKSVDVVIPSELASLPINLMSSVQFSLDATCLWRERTMDEVLMRIRS